MAKAGPRRSQASPRYAAVQPVAAHKPAKRIDFSSHFYNTRPWDEWWHEFSTKVDSHGQLVYKNPWQFAKEKGASDLERRIIYSSIGPKDVCSVWLEKAGGKKKRKTRLPWLGDWQQRRVGLLYFDRESTQKIRDVVHERLDALEAGRGAATVTLEWLARFQRLADKIDAHFGHEPILPDKNQARQRDRTGYYIRLQTKVFNLCNRALRQYLRCHGIAENDLTTLAQMATVGAKAALGGVAVGNQMALEGQMNPSVALIARSLLQKAQLLHLEEPKQIEGSTVEKPPADDADLSKELGKVNGKAKRVM